MAVDTPFEGMSVNTSFTISGWAVDLGEPGGTGVDVLHVWAFPEGSGQGQFVGVPTYGSPRPDIANALGSQFLNAGFRLDAATLAPGRYFLLVYSHSTVTGAFSQVIGHHITVTEPVPEPYTRIDTPRFLDTRSASQSFTISGWAIDRGASGTGVSDVHIWAFQNGQQPGTFVCAANYGQSRPDVGAAFGHSRFNNSGYSCHVPAHMFATGTQWSSSCSGTAR